MYFNVNYAERETKPEIIRMVRFGRGCDGGKTGIRQVYFIKSLFHSPK